MLIPMELMNAVYMDHNKTAVVNMKIFCIYKGICALPMIYIRRLLPETICEHKQLKTDIIRFRGVLDI